MPSRGATSRRLGGGTRSRFSEIIPRVALAMGRQDDLPSGAAPVFRLQALAKPIRGDSCSVREVIAADGCGESVSSVLDVVRAIVTDSQAARPFDQLIVRSPAEFFADVLERLVGPRVHGWGPVRIDLPPLNVATFRERISGGANQGRARNATREEVHS